jgi:hypothetical protein
MIVVEAIIFIIEIVICVFFAKIEETSEIDFTLLFLNEILFE